VKVSPVIGVKGNRPKKTIEVTSKIVDQTNAVMYSGNRAAVRGAIAFLIAISWVALTNHCAIAAFAPRVQPVEEQCPMHSAPAKDKNAENQQCCKTLRAVAIATTKTVSWIDLSTGKAVQWPESCDIPLLARATRLIAYDDTGPPGRRSFAEIVLQRSVLAHAPPFLA
jgi:hypothetical protein